VNVGEKSALGAVFSKNAQMAAENRALFAKHGLFVVNLIGSPGAGKTSLLERTARNFDGGIAVIEGDVKTALDADRIRAAGADSVQIETGGACHLDAGMVARAALQIDLSALDVLVIENVGNLVCPAGVDLGESAKVAIISVPEGDEKPAKYPALFVRADAVVINKTDLLPYVDYSMERATGDCRKLKSDVKVMALSAKTGEGFDAWLDYLRRSRT